MQLKTVKPSHRVFTPLCQPLKDTVIKNTLVTAYTDFSTVHKSYACTQSETGCIQKKHQRGKNFMFYSDKPAVRQFFGKNSAQCYADIYRVEMFKVFETVEMTEYKYGNYFTIRHFMFAAVSFLSSAAGKALFSFIACAYSLQKSSAAQKISVILSLVSILIHIVFCYFSSINM